MRERCVRQLLTDYGYRRCRNDAAYAYTVDTNGGLSEKPPAFLCAKHRKPSVPWGYIERTVHQLDDDLDAMAPGNFV